MPIILISADSENKNFSEFDKMTDVVVDVVLESTDPRCTAIGDFLESKMIILKRFPMDRLNERELNEKPEDAGIRIQAAINVIRGYKIQNAIIISHKSTFDSWDKNAIKDEWDIIGM